MTLSYRDIAKTQLDFLLFRQVRISTSTDFRRWFIYVLVVTWLVGIGRYWDHPSAEVWQYFGLGSVVYIFGLSSLLYVVVLPLRPANWQFRGVLIFVGLTSLPALLYAVPVERFMDLETAKAVNAWFLGLVAAWRVALLLRFLNKSAQLSWALVTIVAVMLLSGIVVTLSILNLEHVVFDIMAGIRDENASPNDLAYIIVLNLSFYSILAFPVALIAYLAAIAKEVRSDNVD
ncbi:MAG: hypothetical protein QNI99_13040 [Woeseiaceae bacterium]|nr:hypothetical protein [Woeseiaceae bacterium]